MHLWKTAATKLSAVNGMRGFRDKIKGTKTKLLRRDSKDSTEEVLAARPAKSAKGAVGGSGDDGGAGSVGSWGRKSKRQSIMGKEASRSDNSLTANSERTVDTNEPQTPTVVTANGNGDVLIEGGSAPKRRSGECQLEDDFQPQLASSKPPLSPDPSSTLSEDQPSPTSPVHPVTDVSAVAPTTTDQSAVTDANREIPVVLVQKDSSDSKAGILGLEDQPSQLPEKPLTENETSQLQPLQSNNLPSSTPSEERVVGNIISPAASTQIPQSEKSTGTDTTANSTRPKRTYQLSDTGSINTTNPTVIARPHHLSDYQFPTDSSGLRTDTGSTTLSQLQRSSSRTSISALETATQEASKSIDSGRKDSIPSKGLNIQETAVYTNTPPQPLVPTPLHAPVPVPAVPEAAQTLDTVSEIGSLSRNSSVKHPRPTLITPSNSRRKQNFSFSRRQSLIHASDTGLLRSLLEQESTSPTYSKESGSHIQLVPVPMPHGGHQPGTRKVWVKRPGGSPTQVIIIEDDFVDTVRDLCLRKYANALGRQYDSPDLMIRILPSVKPQSARRQQINSNPTHTDRLLQPDEILAQILDDYYPNGQAAEDALVVEVPQQQRSRTPRPSPGPHSMSYAYGQNMHDLQLPGEDYFTPGGIVPSVPPSQPGTVRSAHNIPANPSSLASYMASSPPPSSPGHRTMKRPGPVRMTTASPGGSTSSSVQGGGGGVMLMPRGGGGPDRTRSNNEAPSSPAIQPQMIALPSSPGLVKPQTEKPESPGAVQHVASPNAIQKPPPKPRESFPVSIGTLDGQVPAINVLIVEDNIINLKLLEAFMKRLKVRWATAMNGRDAVTKWRTGGFQLVLMDIQLPIMNGLDATKEIRRLERLNGIGSFSSSPSAPEEKLSGTDKLDKSLVFKGSVIIVALTASSLQSDRHEALAVGCNDFLTKPVNFTFLERKVMEWGCMQALIDFEGWRKWRDLASKSTASGSKAPKGGRGSKVNAKEKERTIEDSSPPPPAQPQPQS
ncbi:hypothetical protein ABW19_dt0203778 [Dactylella cylindrospora]|nr:hypothetical protein ABW19_dt0203778 [Dactylella cylindrospora]